MTIKGNKMTSQFSAMILVAAGRRCSLLSRKWISLRFRFSHRVLLCSSTMYRAPVRPQRSPGAPRPTERYPSPASCWGFPGARSPYGGSARGGAVYSPEGPGSNRGYRDGSPSGFGSGSRGFGDSPSGFGSGSRGFGGPRRPRGGGSRGFGGTRWPQSSRPSAHSLQCESSVEKYFSPSMLQDPWEALQPAADPHAARQTS